MWRWLGPTLMAGVFAIAGGTIAAAVANNGAQAVQEGQSEQAREFERTRARGAARVLVLEIGTAITYTARLPMIGRWFSVGADRVPIEMPSEDLQLVAAHVTGDEWSNLLVTIAEAQTVANLMRLRGPGHDGMGRKLGPREEAQLIDSEAKMQLGIGALDELAEAPPP